MANKKKVKSKLSTKRVPKQATPVSFSTNANARPIRQPKARKLPGGKVSDKHVHHTCSITDPFCPAAKGSKYPDDTSQATLSEQFRGNVNVGTVTTTGNGAATFMASAPYGYMLGASATATTVTFQGTAYTIYKSGSMFGTYGGQYRIVSMGCIVRCVANATTAAGTVTLGTTSLPPVIASVLTLGTENYSEVTMKAIQPGMEICWMSKPCGPAAHEFINIDATGSHASHPGDWTSLIIEISGGPTAAATTLLSVEWFINIEFTLSAGNSAIAPLATKPVNVHPAVVKASAAVNNNIGSFIEGGVKAAETTIWNAATSALNSIGNPLDALAALFL
jgi:hypothetical protein